MSILKIVVQRAISNANTCVSDTRDINRATSVGEAKWHVRKYTQPLAYAKLGLAEDIQIMSSACTNPKVKSFGNKDDQKQLAKIFQAWERIDVSVRPYEIMAQEFKEINKEIK